MATAFKLGASDMQYTPTEQPPSDVDPGTGMTSVLTRNRKLLIVGAIALVAFGYFAFTAFQAATGYYLTVDELVERGSVAGERNLQVKGTLVPLTFERESATSTLAYFLLEDGGAQMNATYNGVLPDLFFNPHSEIVLGGSYGPDGVFAADRVLIKCPSKYESLDVENPYDDVPNAA
jgi:cytochrome c-type biogenesis protein CcmE